MAHRGPRLLYFDITPKHDRGRGKSRFTLQQGCVCDKGLGHAEGGRAKQVLG